MLYATCVDAFHSLQNIQGQQMVSIVGRIHKVVIEQLNNLKLNFS